MSQGTGPGTTTDASAHLPPLTGLRVLDLSQVMAGPFCCMLLGDMGADVIKIEPPGVGDQTRKSMGFRMKGEDSPGFLALNRNKRSITLDLKTEAGQRVLHELVKTADILVENSRPGVTKKLGADYQTLSRINPRLIYASISGFGQTGPWSQRPGFDLIAQAMGGVISATGIPGAEPVKSGIPVGDLGAGMFACYGILSAVIGREHPKWGERPVLVLETRNGDGPSDAALMDALRDRVAFWWLSDEVIRFERMPLAATGKIDRMRLRAEFGGALAETGT